MKPLVMILVFCILILLLLVVSFIFYKLLVLIKKERLQFDSEKNAYLEMIRVREFTELAIAVSNRNQLANDVVQDLKALLRLQHDELHAAIEDQIKEMEALSLSGNKIAALNFEKKSVLLSFQMVLQKSWPKLTPSELELCVLIQIGLSTKEIAFVKNVLPESVKMMKNRLKKKLKLKAEDSLYDFLSQFEQNRSK